MFTVSTKSDYGLLLLSLLARKTRKRNGEFVSISSIAKETNLPSAFLSKIASELSSAGVLKSKEGVSGGYKLAKNPKDISVAKVSEILDGPWAPTKCGCQETKCEYEHICPMVDNWQTHLREKMWNLLNSYTLKDLIS